MGKETCEPNIYVFYLILLFCKKKKKRKRGWSIAFKSVIIIMIQSIFYLKIY